MQSYRKIFVCLTGSGKEAIATILKENKIQTHVHSQLSKEELNEHFMYKSMLLPEPKTLARLIIFLNDEKALNNKIAKKYNIILFAEDRLAVRNKPELIEIYNMSDYFVDCRQSNGKTVNFQGIKVGINDVLNQILKRMK